MNNAICCIEFFLFQELWLCYLSLRAIVKALWWMLIQPPEPYQNYWHLKEMLNHGTTLAY